MDMSYDPRDLCFLILRIVFLQFYLFIEIQLSLWHNLFAFLSIPTLYMQNNCH